MTHHSPLHQHLARYPDRMTVTEVADFLRTTDTQVLAWLDARQLGGYRLPDRWLILPEDVITFLTTPDDDS